MKKQQKEEKKSTAKNKGQRIWKVLAIAVLVIFVLIVVGVTIRIYSYKSSLIKPTQAQIDDMTKIATKKLQSMGGNASAFQIHVGSRIKKMHDNGLSRSIIQVSFANNATSHIFLIDVNSGEILLHSETDTYGTWTNHKMYNHHDFMYTSMKSKFFEHSDANKKE